MPYYVLTDTDSTCLMFLIMCNVKNDNIKNDIKKYCEVLFEIIVANKIYDRFDISYPYWKIFKASKPQLQKCFR